MSNYAREGTVRVTYVWDPDPADVAAELVRIADMLDDPFVPLEASKTVLQADMQERFDTETDPEGNKWTPLDARYLTFKQSQGANEMILHRWGPLEEAATESDRFKIVPGGLYFDAGDLPSYGLAHQRGTQSEAQKRDNANIAALYGDNEKLRQKLHGDLAGRGKNLPARPFIGVSDDAEGQVLDIFFLWAQEASTPRPIISPPAIIPPSGGTIFKHTKGPMKGRLQSRVGNRWGPMIT